MVRGTHRRAGHRRSVPQRVPDLGQGMVWAVLRLSAGPQAVRTAAQTGQPHLSHNHDTEPLASINMVPHIRVCRGVLERVLESSQALLYTYFPNPPGERGKPSATPTAGEFLDGTCRAPPEVCHLAGKGRASCRPTGEHSSRFLHRTVLAICSSSASAAASGVLVKSSTAVSAPASARAWSVARSVGTI